MVSAKCKESNIITVYRSIFKLNYSILVFPQMMPNIAIRETVSCFSTVNNSCYRKNKTNARTGYICTLGGTRTRNPRFRRPMPYPLGHEGCVNPQFA